MRKIILIIIITIVCTSFLFGELGYSGSNGSGAFIKPWLRILTTLYTDEIEEYTAGAGITLNSNLNIGSTLMTADGGAMTAYDMQVSATPAAGAEMSYAFKVDGNTIATVYAEADHAGGIQNQKFVLNGISLTSNVTQYTTLTTLTATEIVGTAAGDVGHADGAILVAKPGTGYTLEFISVFFVYDYDTAAYTGGGDDTVIQVGVTGTQVAVTGAITGANLLEAAGDKMLRLGSTATELVHVNNGAIGLFGTALTQPGTAAGVLRCYVTYNIITTGL